ncbi:unnamed protein product [Prunus armeniaca]
MNQWLRISCRLADYPNSSKPTTSARSPDLRTATLILSLDSLWQSTTVSAIEVLARQSMAEADINTVRPDPSWMDPIHAHLTDGTLPTDKTEAKAVRRQSARYLLLHGVLYRRSYSLPLVRCVTPQQGDYILREIHEGACGDHSGSPSLAFKAIRQGYYWPTLHADATQIVQKCDPC